MSEERERGEFKTRLGVRDDVDITELLMSREICDFFFYRYCRELCACRKVKMLVFA